MERANRYDGIDPRVVRSIRHHARSLARRGVAPDMELADYEQDLALDLLRRQRAFDPSRSSFPTFADRVLRHRVATLMSPTLRRVVERQTIRIDDNGHDEGPWLHLDDPRCGSIDGSADLATDVSAFVSALPPALRRYCDILASDNIAAAARTAGHCRSSVYEAAHRLRNLAAARGLDIYVTAGGVS